LLLYKAPARMNAFGKTFINTMNTFQLDDLHSIVYKENNNNIISVLLSSMQNSAPYLDKLLKKFFN